MKKNVKCGSNVVVNSHNNNCNIWANNQATWEGLIGLIYPSDMGYSANSSYWTVQLNWGVYQFNTDAKNSNWLAKLAISCSFWTISPSSSLNSWVIYWNSGGVFGAFVVDESVVAINPTLYLKSAVKITSGSGTKTNPYNLSM